MDFQKALMGNGKYPKFDSEITATIQRVAVAVFVTLDPDHVSLDSPGYIETKLKKQIPILKSIGTKIDSRSGEQTICVIVEVNGKFRSITDLMHLTAIAHAICEIAEDRLSEPEVVKNIGADCKPYVDESEEKAAN